MDVGEFDGRRLYTRLKLDYGLRLWDPTSASRAISAVAELLVVLAMWFCTSYGKNTKNKSFCLWTSDTKLWPFDL